MDKPIPNKTIQVDEFERGWNCAMQVAEDFSYDFVDEICCILSDDEERKREFLDQFQKQFTAVKNGHI